MQLKRKSVAARKFGSDAPDRRIIVCLWNNSNASGLKFAAGIRFGRSPDDPESELGDWSRITFRENPAPVPPQHADAVRRIIDSRKADIVQYAGAGMGRDPSVTITDAETEGETPWMPDVYGILTMNVTEAVLRLWLPQKVVASFSLNDPSRWITEAQRDAGMIGMWIGDAPAATGAHDGAAAHGNAGGDDTGDVTDADRIIEQRFDSMFDGSESS